MQEHYKFPQGGYEITVVDKQDIIKTIEDNIIDKEVMYELISQLEIAATDCLKQGRWTGFPYLGSVKIPEGTLLESDLETKKLFKDAYEQLTHDEFVMFRKKVYRENHSWLRLNKYSNWLVSLAVNKFNNVFKKTAKERGNIYAKMKVFSLQLMEGVGNTYEYLFDELESKDNNNNGE